MADPELVGFHKGALTTLVKERQELVRMVNLVDQLIGAHVDALKKLGVNLEKKDEELDEKLEDILQSS
jgi:hypothetical protein